MTPIELTDEALVARVAAGETAAMTALVTRYQRRVYGMIYRVTGRSDEAEDLFQETWIRVARRAITFDPERSFSPWLATIATHVAIDWLRARRPLAPDDVAPAEAPSTDNPRAALEAAQKRAELAAALAALPDALRQAVLLRYFDEHSEREMAETLDVPKGTVKSRLHHALRALRHALGEEPSHDST